MRRRAEPVHHWEGGKDRHGETRGTTQECGSLLKLLKTLISLVLFDRLLNDIYSIFMCVYCQAL